MIIKEGTKLKKTTLLILIVFLLASLIGCGKDVGEGEAKEVQNQQINCTKKRTITDLGGNVVSIPPAEEIQRIVVMTPPTLSMLLSILPDPGIIIGVNGNAFDRANTDILDKMFSNWKNVETTFMEGFVANTEELLKLKPDIVFYSGDMQKPGIENLGIPIVDMLIIGEKNPEKVTIAGDKLIREIFNIEESTSLEKEWEKSNNKANEVLSANDEEKKSALYLVSNMGGVITVCGGDTHVDSWFEKSGLLNAAMEEKGRFEVSMEQIYEWNPDYIFVFKGTPASKILSNNVKGQNWSLLSSYKNKTIFDIPQSIFSWGGPCSDSPLMPLWMISKSYSELLSEDDFTKLFKDYYERVYDIKLENELIETILVRREKN